MKVLLTRLESSDQGTFGKIYVGDKWWYTLELPWHDNISQYSCIPKAEYKCVWNFSNHMRKYMYQVLDVPNRAGIRIHSGNYGGDSRKGYKSHIYGCVLLGKQQCVMDGQKAMYLSRNAITEFEIALDRKPFILEIR